MLERSARWLALCAMLLQFVASYGHLHPEDFRLLLRGHGATAISHQTPDNVPLGGTAPDIDCSICAAMHHLGSSALPDGVRVPTPSRHRLPRTARVAPLLLSPPSHLLFATRGPPLA